ncbi:MAG: DUF2007 domain-containing protein [Ignavibacteriae bacterium]|nr:DUF2007 domain-containing protein [Ignavibacteriota bacterium]
MSEDNVEKEVYFCTDCGHTVNPDDKKCPKCGADLFETIDLTDKIDETELIDEVAVKVFNSEIEALMAKEQLESEGIKCFISSDNEGGMMPALNMQAGVKLIVNEYNYERAVEILKAMDMF